MLLRFSRGTSGPTFRRLRSRVRFVSGASDDSSDAASAEHRPPAKANHAMRTFVNYPKEFLHKGIEGKHPLSAMKRAKIKKQARVNGKVYRGASLEDGAWDPAWDMPKFSMLPMNPPKGTKRERTVRQRVHKIDKAMAGMAERVEEYRSEADEGQSMSTFEKQLLSNPMFKKLVAEEAEAEKLKRKAERRKARQGKN